LAGTCRRGGRCGDLLAVAAAGQAEAAVGSRRHPLARPRRPGPARRRLRQLGLHHVGADTDPPAALVDLARAALSAEPAPGPPTPPDAPPPPDHDLPHVLLAVWGPKGAPGRTTVAVNLAFEAAPLVGEVLLVDADTYGGAVAQTLGFLEDTPGLAWAARLAGRGELDAPRLWHATRPAAPGAPRVLTGLPRAELWTEVRAGTWESLLELFRAAFPLTVIDAGFCLEEDEELLYDQVRLRRNAVTRLALQRCDLVVAVARADPVGLHAFIRGYQELRDLGVPPRRVRVVVNQLRPGLFGGDRPADQVGSALHRYLGIQPAAFVPYDRAGVDAALLAGQALREARPGCPAQQAIAGLAVALAPRLPTRRGRRRTRAARQGGPATTTVP
jgi:cellulose biosynthesis protein BcsQ